MKINQCSIARKQIEGTKLHVIILIDAEKRFDKIQCHLMIKKKQQQLNKPGIQVDDFNITKVTDRKPTAIIFSGEIFLPKIRNKERMPVVTTSIQQST